MTPVDPETEYAYWTTPGNQVTVTYALNVFHDIEFQVSEGFRRISHGGVETGGLLFGRLEQAAEQISVWIEAFRPIECEHAAGPSFNLSERDVAGIRDQIAAAPTDGDLQGLDVLGWFVAHTRSPLVMNDREVGLFGQLFPGPGRILLLVKPERFQPTRFAFIVRGADGRVERDGTSNAIILPLPGRAGRAGTSGPIASIPAPVVKTPPPAEAPPAAARRAVTEQPPAVIPPASNASERETYAPSFWRSTPAPPNREEPIVRIEEPLAEDVPAEVTALTVLEPRRAATKLPAIDEIKRRRSEKSDSSEEDSGRRSITRKMNRQGRPSVLRLLLLLLLAAGLGCGVGYLAYLQLPSATIALTAYRQPAFTLAAGTTPGLIVTWPAEQTQDAIFASIRVNDGEAIPLSNQQKATGRALLLVHGDNVKIELIAQRRWRDSRGIVRYARVVGS